MQWQPLIGSPSWPKQRSPMPRPRPRPPRVASKSPWIRTLGVSDAQRIHRVGTYASSMDPAGADRLRGFRAPGADEAAGSASPPAQGLAERSGSAQPPTTAGGDRVRPGYDWRWAISANRAPATTTPTPAPTATPLRVTDLYRQVVPSVVLITTSKGSLGSGVIVTDTGTVLTAHHVVSDGGSISIRFADGTKSAATITSVDPKIDIAALTPRKLPEVVVPV